MHIQEIHRSLRSGGFIRAAHYHNTPEKRLPEYEKELALYANHFSSVTLEDLVRYYDTGVWHKEKPGLIISLFNGYRNNYDVMLPLLEKYGFVGWFFCATEFVDLSPEVQKAYAAEHTLSLVEHEYADGRYALNWSEIEEIDAQHVIASHTRSHKQVSPSTPNNVLHQEIVGSQQDFIEHLGHAVEVFTWLYGATNADNPMVHEYVTEANYRFLYGNCGIQKMR